MRYFKPSEFDCPDCGENRMDFDFLEMLITARSYADIPFVITSGYRCEKHNKKVGGSKTSSHLIGKAADIYCPDVKTRFRIVYGLIQAEFTRIEHGKNYIHTDTDPAKEPEIMSFSKTLCGRR